MTQAHNQTTSEPAAAKPDLLDQLAGLMPGSARAQVRAQRTEVAAFTQGSYDTLLNPVDPAGVSLVERTTIALRVAVLEQSAPLIEHYRQQLAERGASAELIAAIEHFPAGGELPARTAALLQHVDRVTTAPRTATPAHLAKLQTYGLSARDLVTIGQLIAFLSFQVRLLAGLQLFAEAA
jgi:CMD domain protein